MSKEAKAIQGMKFAAAYGRVKPLKVDKGKTFQLLLWNLR